MINTGSVVPPTFNPVDQGEIVRPDAFHHLPISAVKNFGRLLLLTFFKNNIIPI
jgi:hypothetical protein